eukprot:336379_1
MTTNMTKVINITLIGIILCITVLIVRVVVIKTVKYYIHSYQTGKATLFFSGFKKYKKPKTEQLPPFKKPLKRGDILVRDFRNASKNNKIYNPSSLRIVSLNIEMGKKINKIISTLKSLHADIICLQEVDLSTTRCHYVDIIGEIATELNMNSLFTVELTIKDKKGWEGYEGNAILTKYDFISTTGLIVDCARYKKYKHKTKTHNEAVAMIDVPNFGKIGCYSLHLDPHMCGVQGRINQYHQILEHVNRNKNIYDCIILCGDLNTACTGINRLHPTIGCDNESRFERIGQTEAEWFDIEGVKSGNHKFGLDLYDPFDKRNDFTMYGLHGMYKAKLDWCLLSSNLYVVNKKVNLYTNRCSDHQWIMCDVTKK